MRRLAAVAALGLVGAAACSDGQGRESSQVIEREVFVATYVDLRLAALSAPELRVSEEARERVLESHGVTEADLLSFVEAYGADPAYMSEVWGEVEERLDQPPQEPDTAA